MPNGVPMAWHVGSYHHLPMWVAEGHGAHFTDVDGHEYRDFNIADMSMFAGYAPEPLVRAVSDRIARGNQFLLPTEDAIVVSEELARRFGLPKWQYTSSATHANTEAMRVARVVTGRDKVLLFDGKYLGHFDAGLVELDAAGRRVPEEYGLPSRVVDGTVDRAVERRGSPRPCARAARRRAGAHGASDHQQHRPAAARPRVPRGAPAPDAARPARCSRTTRRTPRWWVRAGWSAPGASRPTW